jgi:large subunit ribosomal protein L17
MLRNMAASLISHGRIRTTEAKAKELRPFVEKLVTLGKRDSLHARRRALSILPRKEAVQKLFSDVSPRFSERPGGYTRILKLAHRQGDGAAMAFIEFVDFKLKGIETGAPAAPPKAAAAKPEKEEKAEKPEKPEKKASKTPKKTSKAKASAKKAKPAEAEESEKPAKKKRAPRKSKKAEE